eukprot:CFRG5784T1
MSNNTNNRGPRNGSSKSDRETLNQSPNETGSAPTATDKTMPVQQSRTGAPSAQQHNPAHQPFANQGQSNLNQQQQRQQRASGIPQQPKIPQHGQQSPQQGAGRGHFNHPGQVPYGMQGRPAYPYVPQYSYPQYGYGYHAPSGTQFFNPQGVPGSLQPNTQAAAPPRVRKSCALQIIDPNSGKEVQVKANTDSSMAKHTIETPSTTADAEEAKLKKEAEEKAKADAAAADAAAAAEKALQEAAEKERKAEEERIAKEKAEKEEAERVAAALAEKEEAERVAAALAEAKAAEEKAAHEKEEAEKKAEEERLAAEKKIADEKAAAEKKAAEEKIAADAKAAAEKSAAEAQAAKEAMEKTRQDVPTTTKPIDGNDTEKITLPVYPPGMWSPSNQDGIRRYEMDFLKLFKSLITKAPSDMIMYPDMAVDVVPQPLGGGRRGDNRQQMNRTISGDQAMHNRQGGQFGAPRNYGPGGPRQQSQGRGGGGSRNNRDNRGYQQGGSQRHGNQQQSNMFMNRNNEPELLLPFVPIPKQSENAWKPQSAVNVDAIEDEEKKEEVEIELMVRKGISLLNKLTIEKYDKISAQIIGLGITSEARLKAVIDLLFDKALDEPGFAGLYARLCKDLSRQPYDFAEKKNVNSFRRALLNRCQTEFEREQVFASQDGVAAEEMDEKVVRAKLRQVGNIKFIGELFKLIILNEKVIHSCIYDLLKAKGGNKIPEEEDLVCLCNLMETVGKMLDVPEAAKTMDTYFVRIYELSNEKKLSSRVRCVLMDVIDLRKNKWVPRREVSGPKKIEEIHKEAAKEASKVQARHVNTGRHDSRNDRDSRGNRGGLLGNPQYGSNKNFNNSNSSNQSQDGWNTVGARQASTRADVGSLRTMQNRAPSTGERGQVVLGPGGNSNAGRGFSRTDGGSGGGVRLGPGGGSGGAGAGRRGNAFSMLDDGNKSEGLRPGLRGTLLLQPKKSPSTRETAAPALPANEKPKVELEPAEYRTKFKNLLNQTIVSGEIDDIVTSVKELDSPGNAYVITDVVLNMAIEAKDAKREIIGTIYTALRKASCYNGADVAKGLNELMPNLDDIACDAPKATEYIAQMVGPAVVEGTVKLSQLVNDVPTIEEVRTDLASDVAARLVANVLNTVKNIEGEEKAKSLWTESGVKWTDVLPSHDEEAAFMKYQKCEFLA